MESPLNPLHDAAKERNHGGLRRGIYVLPSLLTAGTLVCGYFAALSTLQGSQMVMAGASAGLSAAAFDAAAKALGWAIVFDGFDGRIARWLNISSNFGREFDSLADVIAFGVAPALLAFAWGVRPVLEGPPGWLGQLGWIVTFAFVICGAARLARFNIDSTKATADRRYFIGLPIPAAAGMIAAIVHWRKMELVSLPEALIWMAIVASLAFLMVSRLRYYTFKAFDPRQRRPYVTIIFLGLIVWAIWSYSEPVLLLIALTYAVSGIVLRLISKFRPHPPVAEKVHVA